MLFYSIGCTSAMETARRMLGLAGIPFVDHPCPEVTHLLLDVPSFSSAGTLRCGVSVQSVLEMLPEHVTVIGGNLDDEALQGYPKLDLLQDARYLAENAAITAHCALKLAMQHSKAILPDSRILILGWGRIGKCLAALCKSIGAKPAVFARKEADRAMLEALGYEVVSPAQLQEAAQRADILVNTVPELLLKESVPGIQLELASRPGMAGESVIQARGLPGVHAPESSGRLIAQTVLRLINGKEETT